MYEFLRNPYPSIANPFIVLAIVVIASAIWEYLKDKDRRGL